MSLSSANVSNAATSTLSPQKNIRIQQMRFANVGKWKWKSLRVIYYCSPTNNSARHCLNDFSSDLFAVCLGCSLMNFPRGKAFDFDVQL